LIRYKSFEATGIAPNGKLYAGDLNGIQDAAAALADFTQQIDLGTLRIGEAGLTLSKFGTAEAQLAGHLRVTKILRGLEGIIPGAFTTTQRDAIAAGGAPYGLGIINTTKNKWEWNTGSDGARVWAPFGIDSGVGTLALRPAANAVTPGSIYFATDQVVEYVSDGSSWFRKGLPAGATCAWFGAAAPTGWVKYDGTNLPSSTGIYADLATHLGGVATVDTQGRTIFGQGTHADVDTVKTDNDGLAVGLRRPKHKTSITDPGHRTDFEYSDSGVTFTGLTNRPRIAWSTASDVNNLLGTIPESDRAATLTGITAGPQTGNEPTDTVPYTVGLFIAKL
jgi:hypothetical protein